VQPSAYAPLADSGGEWVIPLRSWSLREQVRSLFVAPNKTGRKGSKMKLRNNTEGIPNHVAARDAAILQDLDLVNNIARRFQRQGTEPPISIRPVSILVFEPLSKH
jgi:hypothetical protein